MTDVLKKTAEDKTSRREIGSDLSSPSESAPQTSESSRRRFLKTTASVGVAAITALAGCSGDKNDTPQQPVIHPGNPNGPGKPNVKFPAALDPRQYAEPFERVVNIVEKGADRTGKQPIDNVLESVATNGTLVYFPPGRYRQDSILRRKGARDLGFVGNKAILMHGRVDAIHQFVVTEGQFDGKAAHFLIGDKDDLHRGAFVFGGFTFDWRDQNAGMQILQHHTAGESVIRNIRQVGRHTLGCQGNFRVNPKHKNAKVAVQNVDMRPGGAHHENTINTRSPCRDPPECRNHPWATSGLTGHKTRKGFLLLDNVWCGPWPDNGLYPKGGSGQMVVRNCVAANSHVSNIRVSGYNTLVENCTVICNNPINDYFWAQNPIRLDAHTPTLRNSKIVLGDVHANFAVLSRRVEQAQIGPNVEIVLKRPNTTGIEVGRDAGPTRVSNVDFKTPGWVGGSSLIIGDAQVQNIIEDGTSLL